MQSKNCRRDSSSWLSWRTELMSRWVCFSIIRLTKISSTAPCLSTTFSKWERKPSCRSSQTWNGWSDSSSFSIPLSMKTNLRTSTIMSFGTSWWTKYSTPTLLLSRSWKRLSFRITYPSKLSSPFTFSMSDWRTTTVIGFCALCGCYWSSRWESSDTKSSKKSKRGFSTSSRTKPRRPSTSPNFTCSGEPSTRNSISNCHTWKSRRIALRK